MSRAASLFAQRSGSFHFSRGEATMPVSEYYKGSGEKVMRSMMKRYGRKGGKRVFYATANKMGMNRPGKKNGKRKKRGAKY